MDNSASQNNQDFSAFVSNTLPNQENTDTLLPPQDPIILNPGFSQENINESSKRGFVATLGLLFAGWLVGNLVILFIIGVFSLGTISSTGLVSVPIVTEFLFGKATPVYSSADQFSLEQAIEKLNQVSVLKKGQKIEKLELTENEVNALLDNQINNNSGFPIGNQKLELKDNNFIFTGNLIKTNAPVRIKGSVKADSLAARVSIDNARFGKINIPSFLASSIVDSSLDKIGLSLNGKLIPAQTLKILEGKIMLQEVVNPGT